MKKTWIIGLLSIIPGLGFFLLGKILQGFVVLFLTGGLLTVGLFSTGNNFSITVITLAFIAWVTQGYFAVLLARSRARTEAGLNLPVREVSIAPPEPDASREEKHLYKVRKTMMELLPQGEDLRVSIEGWIGSAPFLRRLIDTLFAGPSVPSLVYLGVTDQDLIYVKTDGLGKPSELQRVPISQVTLAAIKEGMLSDWMDIQFNETAPLKIEVVRSSREEARQLTGILSGKPYHEVLSSPREQESGSSKTQRQNLKTKHHTLVSGLLGAGGGIAGTIVAALLSLPLGMMLGDGADSGEGLGYLIGIYCLFMFPMGGAILGVIPGVMVGVIRNFQGREVILLPPLLTGFITVIVLSLGALTTIFVIPYP